MSDRNANREGRERSRAEAGQADEARRAETSRVNAPRRAHERSDRGRAVPRSREEPRERSRTRDRQPQSPQGRSTREDSSEPQSHRRSRDNLMVVRHCDVTGCTIRVRCDEQWLEDNPDRLETCFSTNMPDGSLDENRVYLLRRVRAWHPTSIHATERTLVVRESSIGSIHR